MAFEVLYYMRIRWVTKGSIAPSSRNLAVVPFIDNEQALPPCKICGSTIIEKKKNDLKIDWLRGRWEEEWIANMVMRISSVRRTGKAFRIQTPMR